MGWGGEGGWGCSRWWRQRNIGVKNPFGRYASKQQTLGKAKRTDMFGVRSSCRARKKKSAEEILAKGKDY